MINKASRLKNLFISLYNKIISALTARPFASCVCLGTVMTLLLYFLHARSLFGAVKNILWGPGFFIFNLAIMITLYALCLLFRHRLFLIIFTTVFWFAMGVTNCVLMNMRSAPLEGIDFYIIGTGIGIVFMYMSVFEIILCAFLILVFLAALVLLFIKCPKLKPNYKKAAIIVGCCLLALLLIGTAAIKLDRDHKENLNADRHGFSYFFLRSIFDRGIDEPDGYSEDEIRETLADLSRQSSNSPKRKPNIIFVQLESFFDPSRLKNLEFSEDPIKNFRSLAEKFPSGLISVPDIGSGTANTEFEVLSGLDLEFFGTGEYPYESILDDRCCETIAYDLKALGYSTHAIHNHTATFYDRYKVYANLGFDTFTATENIIGIEYNELGWEKDGVLTEYVLKALDSTQSADFVFTVTVQCHGKYPDIPLDKDGAIKVYGADEEREASFEYYINEMRETDIFIGKLYEELCARGEDFVLVLYGDHLPSLELTDEELTSGGLFATDYLIASNFDIALNDCDTEAHRLFPTLFKALGINTGLINKVHAEFGDNRDFGRILELFGYDMLYGDRLAFGETYPYQPTDLKIGLDTVKINSVELEENGFYVKGECFTPSSKVFVQKRKLDTKYVDQFTLYVNGRLPAPDKEITVVQVSADLRRLCQSEPFSLSIEP